MGDHVGVGSGQAGAPLLEVRGLSVSYGRIQVLFDVDLRVDEHEQIALLGTNGAGKSTLLRAVAGLIPVDGGEIRFRGEDVGGLPPHERVGRGMTLVEGGRATFPSLTVAENLRLGAYPDAGQRDLVEQRLEAALELFPALRPRLGQAAGTLSGGEQQMMAVGRALMADPSLLMIDELSLGLAPVVMQQIVGAVEQLAARGTTLLLVEQSLNVALAVADRAYFMEKGEVRFSGDTAELLDRGDLVRSVFFGSRDEEPEPEHGQNGSHRRRRAPLQAADR